MTKIEDVIVPSRGTGKYFGIKCLQIDIAKNTAVAPSFYWHVKTEDTQLVSDVETVVPGVTILDGNLSMTSEEYALWGTDDSYVIDWALAKLGFVEIPE